MYKLHFYDREGNLRIEEVKSKAVAIALAKQAIGKAWVTDNEDVVIYERENHLKLDKTDEL